MFRSKPQPIKLRGISPDGFKRLAKDLYDNASLDTTGEILNGPAMNVFVCRETDTLEVSLRGDLAEVLRRTVTIQSIEDAYR